MRRVSDAGPFTTYQPALRAGVRKPAGKEPAVGGGRLWGFDGGAACRSEVAGVGEGGGLTITTRRRMPLRFAAERFRRDGLHGANDQRPYGNGAAARGAASSGGWSKR